MNYKDLVKKPKEEYRSIAAFVKINLFLKIENINARDA